MCKECKENCIGKTPCASCNIRKDNREDIKDIAVLLAMFFSFWGILYIKGALEYALGW
jgi:hypothetical protein